MRAFWGLYIIQVYGRALKAHDEAKFRMGLGGAVWVRKCRENGTAPCDCDVAYVDRKTHLRVAFEIIGVAIAQAPISGHGVLAGPDAFLSALCARER